MEHRLLQVFIQHLKQKHINLNLYLVHVTLMQKQVLNYHYSLNLYTDDLCEIDILKHYRKNDGPFEENSSRLFQCKNLQKNFVLQPQWAKTLSL